MKKVEVLNNQNIFDLAIRYRGLVNSVFDIALKNDVGITQTLAVGTTIVIPYGETDINITSYMDRKGIKPGSNRGATQTVN